MTVHWLNPRTMERMSGGLACRRIKGKHTYDVIAGSIESILTEFEIQNKTSCIVTDNATNFAKAFRYFYNFELIIINYIVAPHAFKFNGIFLYQIFHIKGVK